MMGGEADSLYWSRMDCRVARSPMARSQLEGWLVTKSWIEPR